MSDSEVYKNWWAEIFTLKEARSLIGKPNAIRIHTKVYINKLSDDTKNKSSDKYKKCAWLAKHSIFLSYDEKVKHRCFCPPPLNRVNVVGVNILYSNYFVPRILKYKSDEKCCWKGCQTQGRRGSVGIYLHIYNS